MMDLVVAPIDGAPDLVDHIRAIQLARVDAAIRVLHDIRRIHTVIDGDAVEVAARANRRVLCPRGTLLAKPDHRAEIGVNVTRVLLRVGIARLTQVVDIDLEPVERAVEVLVAVTLGRHIRSRRHEIRHLVALLADVLEGADAIEVKLFDR